MAEQDPIETDPIVQYVILRKVRKNVLMPSRI